MNFSISFCTRDCNAIFGTSVDTKPRIPSISEEDFEENYYHILLFLSEYVKKNETDKQLSSMEDTFEINSGKDGDEESEEEGDIIAESGKK